MVPVTVSGCCMHWDSQTASVPVKLSKPNLNFDYANASEKSAVLCVLEAGWITYTLG